MMFLSPIQGVQSPDILNLDCGIAGESKSGCRIILPGVGGNMIMTFIPTIPGGIQSIIWTL
jgi:hypothetical protein